MATPVVRLRRSATQSAVPTTAQLALGEVAINTFDGKLFIKKDNGTESIVEIGAGAGGGGENYFQSTAPTSPSVGDRWVNSDDGICYVYYNDGNSSQWIEFGSSYTVTGATEPAAAQETISSFLLMGA